MAGRVFSLFPPAEAVVVKYMLPIVAAILAGLAYLFFGGDKWSGHRWVEYSMTCIPAKLGTNGNLIQLPGEGELAGFHHALTAWTCPGDKMMVIYEGLPENVPAKLTRLRNEYNLRYKHGLLFGDDSHRFVSREEIDRLKTLADWDGIVKARPY